MYYRLFKNVTDALRILQTAQIEVEQMAMTEEDPPIELHDNEQESSHK